MPCCEISDCAQKSIIAVRHLGLGGHESLETAVNVKKIPEISKFAGPCFSNACKSRRILKNESNYNNVFFVVFFITYFL